VATGWTCARQLKAAGPTSRPVTPGSAVPAREALGELLLDLGRPTEALRELEAPQKNDPNRRRASCGAGRAAELAGDETKARAHYGQVVNLASKADTERPEVVQAEAVLA
jgi:Flp pilus assembly protein TadD